jgi:starch-binding outer membrane protein SusE/F
MMKKLLIYCAVFMAGTAIMVAQPYANMSIVGAGAGGWPGGDPQGFPDANQMETSDGGTIWTADNMVLTNGDIKFRTGNHWDPNTDNWGATTETNFPTGTGAPGSGTNIHATAGIYDVTFNTATLAYSFVLQSLYPAVSLIGTGNDGVAADADVDLFTADGITYTGTDLHFVGGTLMFRQDHANTINWSSAAFPIGVGTQGGAGIVIPGARVLNVTFNRTTGAYAFSVPSVAIVGSATPQGWPNDPQVDAHILPSEDGINYMLGSITLVAGAAKFREQNSWAVQWGGNGGFPNGIGSQNGTDIPITAGTYSVSLNRTTGAYAFGTPAATAGFTKGAVMAYPNPASSAWTFSIANGTLTNVQVVDLTGKVVVNQAANAQTATVNASALANGVYFARVSSPEGVSTLRIVKN